VLGVDHRAIESRWSDVKRNVRPGRDVASQRVAAPSKAAADIGHSLPGRLHEPLVVPGRRRGDKIV
jgi:hypothetical protein